MDGLRKDAIHFFMLVRYGLRHRLEGSRMRTLSLSLLMAGLFACASFAHADGLADMRAALAQLKGQSPIKAVLEAHSWHRTGEGRAADEEQGQASVGLEDAGRGLQVTYGRDLTARIDTEQRSRVRDPANKTPTLTTLKDIDIGEMLPMVSSGAALLRVADKAAFKGERSDAYNGKPARVLTFDLPVESLNERDRKYTKKFSSTVDVWIGADGTPLASRSRQVIGGRAFVVISFDSVYEEQFVFGVNGDRLLTLRRESKFNATGAGERDERKIVRTLQVLPL
jgi:hypothetical protein